MNKTWFIADTHFNHKNVIDYDHRPFADVSEMENEIVSRWNKRVNNGDIVWMLGDFDFRPNKDTTRSILKRLKGRKFLVKGNHDVKSNNFYRECGFEEVYDKPIILKDYFILSHEPIFITKDMPYFNIYGHVHNHTAYKDKTDNSCCVCCCRWNYEPIRIPEFEGLAIKYSLREFLNDIKEGVSASDIIADSTDSSIKVFKPCRCIYCDEDDVCCAQVRYDGHTIWLHMDNKVTGVTKTLSLNDKNRFTASIDYSMVHVFHDNGEYIFKVL